MWVEQLSVRGLRCLTSVDLLLPPSGAWLLGPNGAGKSSVLEALCLLGFGRSFRGRVADGLIQRGFEDLEVVAHWVDRLGRRRISGLRHAGDTWDARLDGHAVKSLAELAAPFAVLCFHPESTALVSGPAEDRRRVLDWLAFHVEPDFSGEVRTYSRSLRQRNTLLRSGAPDAEIEPWEWEMARAAARITAQREVAVQLLAHAMRVVWPSLIADASPPELLLRPGWRQSGASLADLLLINRSRDRELGYTTVGPHRADLDLGRPFDSVSSQWSRGQSKLIALALSLAQAAALREWNGDRCLLLLDDLQAELDPRRQLAVLDWLDANGHQALATGTDLNPLLRESTQDWGLFHVEQGRIEHPVSHPPPL